MTWVYIALAVVVILWATWVTCQAMYLMGRDIPDVPDMRELERYNVNKPGQPETIWQPEVQCFRCGMVIPDAELGSHSCGTDDTQ